MQASEIKQKILKAEGLGFNRPEIVKVVSEQCGVSRQDVYYHLGNRAKWQSDFLNFKDSEQLQNLTLNRINHIYREASFQLQQTRAEDHNAKVGYLRVMLEASAKLAEYGLIPELTQEVEQLKKIMEAKNHT